MMLPKHLKPWKTLTKTQPIPFTEGDDDYQDTNEPNWHYKRPKIEPEPIIAIGKSETETPQFKPSEEARAIGALMNYKEAPYYEDSRDEISGSWEEFAYYMQKYSDANLTSYKNKLKELLKDKAVIEAKNADTEIHIHRMQATASYDTIIQIIELIDEVKL